MSDKKRTDLHEQVEELQKQLAEARDGWAAAERLLAEQAALFNSLIEAFPDPLMVIDARDHTVLMSNRASGCRLNGLATKCYNASHHRGEPCAGEEHPCPIEAVRASRKPFVTEHTHYDHDGNKRTILLHAFPVFDSAGELSRVVEYGVDSTEKILAEREVRQSRRILRNVIDATPGCIYVKDRQGTYLLVNREMALIHGLTPETMLGLSDHKLAAMPGGRIEHADKFRADDLEVIESKQPKLIPEETYRLPDGRIRYFQTYKIPLALADDPDCLLGVSIDITERKLHEQRQNLSEQRFRELAEMLPEVVFEIDLQGRLTFANRQAFEIMGYEQRDFDAGLQALDFVVPEQRKRLLANVRRVHAREDVGPQEYTMVRKDGSLLPMISRVLPIVQDGGVVGIRGIFLDISERMRHEEALRRSEERYRLLVENLNEGIWQIDADSNTVYVNLRMAEMLGYAPDEMLGRPLFEFMSNEAIEQAKANVERRRQGINETHEFEFRRKDGTPVFAYLSTSPVLDEQGKYAGALAAVTDISERMRMEQALRDHEERFRTLFEFAPDALYINDLQGTFIDGNAAAEKIIGYSREKMIGSSFMKLALIVPEQLPRAAEMLAANLDGRSTGPDEFTLRRSDGRLITVEIATHPVRIKGQDLVLGVARDISARKRSEEERNKIEEHLRRQQRLEEIGTLAGGVAHEINNPLQVIINFGELISELLQPGQENLREYAGRIVAEGDRAAEIVQNLMQFARQEDEPITAAFIKDMIDDTLTLIRTMLRKDRIALVLDLPDDLPRVTCRPRQIQQVLINLVTNARNSINMKQSLSAEERLIRIEARQIEREGRRRLRITVQDRGVGMGPTVSGRIFDPFFTTKQRNEATGLGLAVSYRIMRDHKGELSFDSEPGQGASFHIDLPL